MHVFLLILTIFFQGSDKAPETRAVNVDSLAECHALGPQVAANLETHDDVSGVTVTCGEIDVPVSHKV